MMEHALNVMVCHPVERWYVERCDLECRNRKTSELNYLLSEYEGSLLRCCPDEFLLHVDEIVRRLNLAYHRCNELLVMMPRIGNMYQMRFYAVDKNNDLGLVGHMTLRPVLKVIG